MLQEIGNSKLKKILGDSMGLVQHRQLKNYLIQNFNNHVDASDITTTNADEREKNILSRALSAFSVTHLAGIAPIDACFSITDGYKDCGIDAIYFDKLDRILYLVQSKWNSEDKGSVDQGGIDAFIAGTRYLLQGRVAEFNDKISSRWSEIESAVNDAFKVVLVLAYSGSTPVHEDLKRRMHDYLREVDDTGELVGLEIIGQQIFYNTILNGVDAGQVVETLNIFDWGQVSGPPRAFYGQMAASDLASLHDKFGNKIFSKNIRFFVGATTDVNTGVRTTLSEEPEHFWYFNNGITIVSDSVRRKPVGGATRDHGAFECVNLSIINGAQTVGSISAAHKDGVTTVENARVPVRLISLENAPEDFSRKITRTNNTQNRIDSRNFVALDPEQERLKAEFKIDGTDYEYRQGEIASSGPKRLDLVEATVALACTSSDVSLAVQAKREIGKLWEDIGRYPYRALFNPGVAADHIWAKVVAFRKIDAEINKVEFASGSKTSQIAVHGNRLLAFLTYQKLSGNDVRSNLSDVPAATIVNTLRDVVNEVDRVITEQYPENYLASLFKNLSKCKEIVSAVLR